MAVKPIIFSAPMVRALVAGRKTQTRRVLKHQPQGECSFAGFYSVPLSCAFQCRLQGEKKLLTQRVPYAPGDLLWVREAWAPLDACTHNDPGAKAMADRGFYRADHLVDCGDVSRWRPSIHMPRWASRLTLRVTHVRVQRVQEITPEDAEAEGLFRSAFASERAKECGCDWAWGDETRTGSQVSAFAALWSSINARRGFGWDTNPWVSATTFEVIRKNVDEVTHG